MSSDKDSDPDSPGPPRGDDPSGLRGDGPSQPSRGYSPLRPPPGDKRLYFVLMAICIGLFVLSWAVVDRYSTVAAVIMTIVALIIPPFAAIVANAFSAADRRRR
jgi:hypothetical protein